MLHGDTARKGPDREVRGCGSVPRGPGLCQGRADVGSAALKHVGREASGERPHVRGEQDTGGGCQSPPTCPKQSRWHARRLCVPASCRLCRRSCLVAKDPSQHQIKAGGAWEARPAPGCGRALVAAWLQPTCCMQTCLAVTRGLARPRGRCPVATAGAGSAAALAAGGRPDYPGIGCELIICGLELAVALRETVNGAKGGKMLFLLNEKQTTCVGRCQTRTFRARFGWDAAVGFATGPGARQRGNSTFRDGNQVPGSHL